MSAILYSWRALHLPQFTYGMSGYDAILSKPAAVHFQCIERIALGIVCICRIGLHFLDVEDGAVSSDESYA